MIIEIVKIAKEVKVDLPDLITRPVGRKVFERTLGKLVNVGEDETVVVDFEGVKVIDPSFVDEFIINLVNNSIENNYYIKLKNISNIIEINIDSVFKSYSTYSKRIAVVREDLGNNNRYYIGPLADFENDIIDYLKINKHAGVDEISKFSGLNREETEKTLNELVDLKLIRLYDNKYTNV